MKRRCSRVSAASRQAVAASREPEEPEEATQETIQDFPKTLRRYTADILEGAPRPSRGPEAGTSPQSARARSAHRPGSPTGD